MSPSSSHIVLIPSYNSRSRVLEVARAAASSWNPVWILDDGSSDGSLEALQSAAIKGVSIWALPKNRGKGAAVLCGMQNAYSRGFTHALVMDADGQHSAEHISSFMKESQSHPDAMILGRPQFGTDAPRERVYGRRIGNWFANLETLGRNIDDSLFGFRVYPLAPSLKILQGITAGREFDFDTQLVVRLYWEGIVPRNLDCPVYYPHSTQGGTSHFRYLRDNFLLVRTHTCLLCGMLRRIPQLLNLRRKRRAARKSRDF